MNKTILVFAPHNDDEVIGVGGTIIKEAQNNNTIVVCEVTTRQGKVSLAKKDSVAADKVLGVNERIFLDLPVVALNEVKTIELNKAFCDVVQRVKPDEVYIPHFGDMHIDHRMVADAAMVALRPLEAPFVKKIYGYETLSETEWNIPNVGNAFLCNSWNDISAQIKTKLEAMECYKSQVREFPHPRSLKAIEALAQYRGSTIGVCYAEAFNVIREIK